MCSFTLEKKGYLQKEKSHLSHLGLGFFFESTFLLSFNIIEKKKEKTKQATRKLDTQAR